MNLLVTAGNTHAPIDRVRVLTNVFTGRTGAAVARAGAARGHRVTLLTSQPDTLAGLPDSVSGITYRTFDDLADRLQGEVSSGNYDGVILSAAVSDYLSAGVYAPDAGTAFDADTGEWRSDDGPPRMRDQRAGKVKSTEPELWLRLVRAPKLIDQVRGAWHFAGLLVKFKLEVGVGDAELLTTAERSRQDSGADLMVANTLEGSAQFAYLGPVAGQYIRVERRELPERLIVTLEHLHRERTGEHG
jgi:phosphopantothenoylcysteine synthetase/decarboxylase